MDKYLFIKMLYIADRESLGKWGEPITGDFPVSMEHGPVLSIIYDLTKGEASRHRRDWSPFISDADKQTNQVCLKAEPSRDQLSRNELRLIEEIFHKFKGLTWLQMKAHCHAFQEYEDVGKTAKAIAFKTIFTAVGKSEEQIKEIESLQREIVIMDTVMAD